MADKLEAWGEDPIWSSYVKAPIRILGSLSPAYDHAHCGVRVLPGGRNVEKFRLLGYVVSLKSQTKKTEFMLDDGTGMICCTWWIEQDWNRSRPLMSHESIKLGCLIHVGGTLNWYENTMQLNVSYASLEFDPNAEALFWLETVSLYRGTYSAPPVRDSKQRRDERERKKARLEAAMGCVFVGADAPEGGKASEGNMQGEDRPAPVEPGTSIEDAMKQLMAKHETFDFRMCLGDADVMAAAEREVRKKAGTASEASVSTAQCSDVIRKTLFAWRKMGVVYIKDEEKDLYAGLSLEDLVVPFCISLIQQAQVNARDSTTGCHVDEIVGRAKQNPHLKHLDRSVLLRALGSLVERSRIFVSGNMEYRLVE